MDQVLRQQIAGNYTQRPVGQDMLAPPDSVMRDIAFAAYDPPSKVKGYTLVPGLSTKETVVYINPASRQAVVAFRGSVTKDDWLVTDYALYKGHITDTARFERSKQQLAKVKTELRGFDVYTTGHSLGGKLSDVLTNDVRTKGNVSFNSGQGRADAIPEWMKPSRYKTPKARSYINRRDIVSALGNRVPTNEYYSRGYLVGAHRASPTKWSNRHK